MSQDADIFIGIGANLASARHGPPLDTCRAALPAMEAAGIRIIACARWYQSRPVPPSDQPPYINGVVRVATDLAPRPLLDALHAVEAAFGRVRRERNAARVLDLDLLAYGDRVADDPEGPILPHPRMHERAFVLRPLAELAPDWRHPRLGVEISDLLRALPADAEATPVAAGGSPCAASGENL